MSWVMFDFGGVISTPQPEADVAAMAAVAGVTVPELRSGYWPLRPTYDGGTLSARDYWDTIASQLGTSLSDAQVAELSRLDIASWSHLHPGTLRLIDDLEAAGVRLALLSNAPDDMARVIESLPVAQHFEHLLFSCDLGAAKPGEACFHRALDRLGAPAAEVTFVDDRADNVAAAARLGMCAVHFTDVEKARAGIFTAQARLSGVWLLLHKAGCRLNVG